MCAENNTEKKKLILVAVVDDHIYTATAIAQKLENMGFRTIQAYNGPSAIKKCLESKPDVVLLDVNLTGLNGFEVAAKLTGTKIIFMTGSEEFVARAKNTKGCIAVVMKPVDVNLLIEVLRKEFKIKAPNPLGL
ncbi:MAG: response regulator [Candidatus Diapherotrites archaeon]|nr:response regulator [Candidatus Diapherotrites archaeon]